MSLRPIGLSVAKPTFRANEGGQTVVPNNVRAADLETPQPKYMPAYKPGFVARVRAFFRRLTETVKGSFVGLCYGVTAGAPAAAATALMLNGEKAVKNTQIGKVVLASSVIASTLAGAFVGKKGMGESIKGAGVGLLYGLAAGIPATLVAVALKGKGAATAAKAVLIAATAVSTIIGAYVGKLIANGKVANIYMQHGAVENLKGNS